MLQRDHLSERPFRAAKLRAALAVAAGLLLLWMAAPADAAEPSPGSSTAAQCGNFPGDLCTCTGGRSSADCGDLMAGGSCSGSRGPTLLCCRGNTCQCRKGGSNPGETCPAGSLAQGPGGPGRLGQGILRQQRPPKAVPPDQTGGSPGRVNRTSGHNIVQMSGREAAPPKGAPPTTTGGSPPSRTPTSGHNVVSMSGREAAPPKKTGGTSSSGKFTSGHNVIQMSGRNLPKAARSDVPLQAGGPFDGAELCQCDKGNGWCLWINNRCTAGTEAPWNCDGVCKESKKK